MGKILFGIRNRVWSAPRLAVFRTGHHACVWNRSTPAPGFAFWEYPRWSNHRL